ncbi:MAG: glycerol-3-phosphate dehydrogenase (NAD(P)+) [Bradymonadia bacterium]|jgi:glycerol-3-phosphate dehydrogenase (NAD(P)+)
MTTAVIGGGSWGTALASVLAHKGPVRLWARSAAVAEGINTLHRNPRYQSDLDLPKNIVATTSMAEALADVELVCVVVPSHAMRGVMTEAAPLIPIDAPIVSAAKGIENGTLQTMEDVLLDVIPRAKRGDLAFLSGPSFARETILQMATAVTIAARFDDVAHRVQAAFCAPWFRSYTTEDVTGVELGGALKNVIAIAAGVADGMGLGHNSRAALLTRGLAEIGRMAVRLGANPMTLAGLSGMGDLVLTCTGGLSRNRHVGVQLGEGKTLTQILGEMNEVAEGVKTAKSTYDLAEREKVDMPICREVYRIIYEEKPPAQALKDLMGRDLRRERDG